MKQETLDYVAGSIGIIATISTYIFWLASRQIKVDLVYKIDKFCHNFSKKQESDTISTAFKLRRWQDMNKLRWITLECRMEAIEKKLDIGSCNIIESIERQFDDEDED
ncbi:MULTISPECIES: hypothetical protein [unclassified Microcoleus]|uniref:hypothetical protein n=1 Tax=unclassified Microcoleus TaxID=2642155 RepID=UPI002FD489E6